ncbi:hypothetical protein SALBM135S_04249 [Streptomyces alboniger]
MIALLKRRFSSVVVERSSRSISAAGKPRAVR